MSPRPDLADHSARILIVDDDRRNRQLLEVMLSSEGFLLSMAESGEEALATVAQQPPDLILLDIMMPGMDGYQVAAKIKGNLATKNIPVVMVTGLGDHNARILGLNAGAEDFLTKPVDRAELRARVRNLLRLKAYGDYYDEYSQVLESEVASRTADLVERTKSLEQQAVVLTEQAALLDLEQDAIVVENMDGRILLWSRGAEVMYGWLSTEALGRNTGELLGAESAPSESVKATLLRQGHWEGEAIHHRRDGGRLIVASRWALQRDAVGAPVRILTINNDVTDRKQADSELLLLTKREQSRQDQMRFKDEFLSHVSHELRSPLTAIKQFTTILLGGLAGELNREQSEYQQIVLKNIQQLQSMIGDLLEVTRLETGKLNIEPESVSIVDAVTDALNTLQVTARAQGVTLSCHVPPGLSSAHADQTRLRQILIILLDNAIKFTLGSGAVTVRARQLPHDPRFLLLEVSDTGCGICPEMIERIFERLSQESKSTHTSRKGLGLGLYICRELVTRQGGRIWANSQLQKGSTFSFTLPVFSLNNLIAPLLKNDQWPTESVALVAVEMGLLRAPRSKESEEERCHEARGLIQGCLMPNLDVLLPKMGSGGNAERFFVAAFADDKGAAVLAKRIREQFDRLTHLKLTGQTLSVSYTMLHPPSRRVGASTKDIVTTMATHLEESVNSRIISEEIYHE
jgi:PAS domain S-box-containing protein